MKMKVYESFDFIIPKYFKGYAYVSNLVRIAERFGVVVFEIKTKTISVIRTVFWRAIRNFFESTVILLLAYLSFIPGQSN